MVNIYISKIIGTKKTFYRNGKRNVYKLLLGAMVQSIPRDPENHFSRTVQIGRFPGSRYPDAFAFPIAQWLVLT